MRRDVLLMRERIDAGTRIREVVGDLDAGALRADRLRLDSMLWNFTILGEAAARVPGEVKERHPSVGWAQPTRLRNRIVHGYWSVDVNILHAAAVEDLPKLLDQLLVVLDTYETEPGL